MASGKKSRPSKTVDEYIASAPREMQPALRDLRKAIRIAAPEAKEGISWRMPSYKYHGVLVFFAAFKNHMSFFPASYSTVKDFKAKLKPFEVTGTTIHFTAEKPLPPALVRQMVKARTKENELRAKPKK